jgi:hypothetical protein
MNCAADRLTRESGIAPASRTEGPSRDRRTATIKAVDAARNALKLGKLEAAIDDLERALNMAREEHEAERCATVPPPSEFGSELWELLP